VPLVIMLTDVCRPDLSGTEPRLTVAQDEKYYFSEKQTIENVERYSRENAKDIVS